MKLSLSHEKFFIYLLFLVSVIGNTQGAASGNRNLIVVLYSKEYSNYSKLLTRSLIREHKNSTVKSKKYLDVTAINTSHAAPDYESKKAAIIIAIGPTALEKSLSQKNSIPILATLISRNNYTRILDSKTTENRKIGALYVEQPISRLFDLAKSVIIHNNGINKLGILISKENKELEQEIKLNAKLKEIKTFIHLAREDETTTQAMQTVIDNSDMILAIPDNNIFNANTVSGMLMTAIKSGIPVIGYSRAYSSAGALATVYSNSSHHINTITREALAYLYSRNAATITNTYCNDYQISLNDCVAKATKVSIPNNTAVVKSIMDSFAKEH